MKQPIQLKNVKPGQFFTRKAYDCPKENQVYIRGSYDRSSKRYDCERFSDMCDTVSLKGETLVYTDFTF